MAVNKVSEFSLFFQSICFANLQANLDVSPPVAPQRITLLLLHPQRIH